MSSRRTARALAAAAILVIGGGFAWWAIARRGDRPTPDRVADAGPVGESVVPAPIEPPEALAAPGVRAKPRIDGDPPAIGVGSLVVHVHVASQLEGVPSPNPSPAPIVGAEVVVVDGPLTRRAVSDARGEARFEALPVGTVQVTAAADKFVRNEALEVEIAKDNAADIVLELERGVPFDGRVVDELGRPFPGARVAIEAGGSINGSSSSSSREDYDETISDANGGFHVRGIPDGELATAVASAPGRVRGAKSVRALAGRVVPSPVEVRLEPAGRVVGVVRDPEGKPVASAEVFVIDASDDQVRRSPRTGWRRSDGTSGEAVSGSTREDGTFLLDGLRFGIEYVAVAEHEGFARSVEVVDLRPHAGSPEVRADLTLRKTAAAVLRLVDLEGRPVTADSHVYLDDFLSGLTRRKPDEGHSYRFDAVQPGEHVVHVDSPAFLPPESKFETKSGETADVVIRLDPGARADGVVVDEEGQPVAGARVNVGPYEGNERPIGIELTGGRSVKTRADGRFSVSGFKPGDSLAGAEFTDAGSQFSYQTEERTRFVAPTSELRLVVVRLGEIRFRVLTPDGVPYTGPIFVWSLLKNQGGSGSGRDVKDGVIRVGRIQTGLAEIRVELEGYAPFRREAEIHPRDVIDWGDVKLDRGVDWSGRVVDAMGAPVVGVTVQIEEPSGLEGVATDEHGAFTFHHVPAGPVEVEIQSDDYLEAREKGDTAGGPKVIVLRRGTVVRGTYADSEGKPLAEVDFFATQLGADGKPLRDEEREWISTEKKGAFWKRLPPGRWRFTSDGKPGEAASLGELDLPEGETKEWSPVLPRK